MLPTAKLELHLPSLPLRVARFSVAMSLGLLLASLATFAIVAIFAISSSPAAAGDLASSFRNSDLPVSFHYLGSNAALAANAPALGDQSLRRQLKSTEPPSRYQTRSILRYSKPLGDTGLVLRVKAPLKQRQLVRFELRF